MKTMYGIIYKIENGFSKKSCNMWVFNSLKERREAIVKGKYPNDDILVTIKLTARIDGEKP